MKKLLNTLYITTPESYLSKDGLNIVVSLKGEEIFRIPIQNVEAICTFGYQGASPGLMKLCVDNGVSLSFFSPHGRFVSRIQGGVHGNILLRKRQYELVDDDDMKLRLSSRFIMGKIYNSRLILRRFVRDYSDRINTLEIEDVCDKLKDRCVKTVETLTVKELRGIEGESARQYYSVFDQMILNSDSNFKFVGRCKRPPTDIVNCMLSFGYSMLANDCVSALEGVGLDPAAGFMHTIRPGRNSLALDLMEELRAYIVDRLVISMINNRQISPKDFQIHDGSEETPMPVLFKDSGLKKFLTVWQNRKKEEITHPFLKEKIKIGLLPHVQSLLLARFIRRDLDDYPVFTVK